MPGTAIDALEKAFDVLSDVKSMQQRAPFILMDYTVQILQRPSETVVAFYPNAERFPFAVHLQNGGVVSHDRIVPTLDVQPILIPGVTAGELVAVYAKAMQDNDSVTREGPRSFEMRGGVVSGGLLLAFIPSQPPPYFKTHACVTGNCNGRSVYKVTLSNNNVVILRRAIL
jgi:hypothetical protein